jgi:hypothetical protein
MTTGSVFWFVVFAASGGVFVFVGLLLEQFSEKDWYNSLSDSRRCKSRKFWGEWIVIGGIVVEIGVGVFSAIDAWKNEPLNRPVRNMSALVSLKVRGSSFKEIDIKSLTHRSISWVALLNVYETNEQPSDLMPGTLVSESFSKGYFRDAPDSDRLYSMRFDPILMGSHLPTGRLAKEIAKIKRITIGTWFLPRDTEILGGNVSLLVNSEIEIYFQIPPQIVQTNGSFSIPVFFATNASRADLKQIGFSLKTFNDR